MRMNIRREKGAYEKYIKRGLDIVCSLLALIAFFWLYALIALLVRWKMGSPVLFQQPRPGMIDPKTNRERIFCLYKFRTMSDARDENGNLLPDEVRLGKFGEWLRSTSLDELPEVLNILRGDMSVIGPRPQLVRDLVFMTDRQRMRHTAKPGLSGLAQVMGRNSITWEEKIDWDLKYIENVSFWNDAKIVWITFRKVFLRSGADKQTDDVALAADYGDALLDAGKVSREEYDALQARAKEMLREYEMTR